MKKFAPDGHFYSPIVEPESLRARADEIWPASPSTPDVDYNPESHEHLLREVFPRQLVDYDYPDDPIEKESWRFFHCNPLFSHLDSRCLFALLLEWRPQRYLEIGGGFSTLLAADVNRRFLGGSMEVTSIEPYPRPELQQKVPGLGRLVDQQVEKISPSYFDQLESGDVLFIDSSHVCKTGSDCHYLYFDVLPRLQSGVRIHVHDIFLPRDYPRQWVLDEGRSWNEQYVLRALLSHSNRYRVVFGCSYAEIHFQNLVCNALGVEDGHGHAGGSFWMEVQ